jgi:hypothetical protein
MSDNIDYKITADTSKAVSSTNQLTAANVELTEQLKIAKKNLLESVNTGGAYSKASKEAAVDVNNLTAQIKSNNETIKENSKTTKDATVTQGFFEKTMRSVTGNSTAYERAMKSMGVSVGISDGLTKLIMFSTIAYDQAVTAITAKKELETAATVAEAGATTVATGAITGASLATWALNSAIAVLLAPLTLLVAVFATVATGAYFLIDALDETGAAQNRLDKITRESIALREKDIESRKKLQSVYDHNNEQAIKLAEAKGLEGKALEKLELRYKSNEIAMAMMNAETQKSIFLSARKAVLDAKANGEDEAVIKKLKDTYDKEFKVFTEFRDQVEKKSQEYRDIKSNADIAQAKKDSKEADEKKPKKKEDKTIENMQKGLEKLLKIQADGNFEIDQLTKDSNEKELIRQEEQYQKLADLKLANKELQREIDLKYWSEESDNAVKRDEEDKQRKQANQEATLDLANAGFDSLANLTEAFAGKSKKSQAKALKIQGAVNVAQIGANTASGMMNALGTSSNTYEGTAKAIAVGITGATQTVLAIKNTSKALSALGEGGAPSGGNETQQSSVSPQIGFQNSSENQIATTISTAQNQQNIKVSVLASDITTAQDDIKTDVVNNSF